jgi:hypothetical protein
MPSSGVAISVTVNDRVGAVRDNGFDNVQSVHCVQRV